MDFIKILFNIALTVLPLLLLLLLQIPAARTENKFQNSETTTTVTTTTTKNLQTTTNNNKNKNNLTLTSRELRKHEQIIDNSIDFTADPCDDFYQYACGEWKQQLYDTDDDGGGEEDDSGANDRVPGPNNDDANDDTYDRTLAMIDFLADKEVLKYFHMRNMTKNLNTTTTTRSQTATTKEPDFIIKVYKYYKSCIAIQQYEPIKYLEWLELNEHVKWPSLINTTTTESTNNAEHDGDHQQQHHLHEHDAVAATHKTEVLDEDDDEEEGEDEVVEENNDELGQDVYNTTWIYTLAILRKYGLNGIFIEEVIYNTKTFPSKLFLGFNKPTKEGGFKSLKSEHFKIILNNLNLHFTQESFKNLWLNLTKFEWLLTKLNDLTDDLGTTMITLEHFPVPWLEDYLKVIFNQTAPLDSNMRLVITNVAYFMALDELLNEYDDKFLNQYLQIRFLWHLYQQEPHEFQSIECIQHIKHFVPLAFEWIFEKQNSQLRQEIPKIHDIYSNLRRQFNVSLYNNKINFDSSSLEKLVSKLETIQLKVGTFGDTDPSDFFYENRKFYQTLKLSTRDFYLNHLKMLKFNFEALHFGLRTLNTNSNYYDMQEYQRGLSTAPYFNKRLNTLHIPLALLQPPLYHPEFTDIYKYSTIGFILAQTLMYGFNIDNLATNEPPKLLQHFKCLGSLDPLQVPDKIADANGLRLAYHTFFHAQNNNLISNRKIFFLNFAQTFCAAHTVDNELGRSHVNYGLAQFTEFAKTFECSPDSHMNPHEKCYLWD